MSTATLGCTSKPGAPLAASLLPVSRPPASRRVPPPAVAAARPNRDDMVDDRLLVKRCLAGDTTAWEEVLRLYSRRVYTLCLRFTGRPEDADDLTQEVFIRLYRSLGTYRTEMGSFSTWLTTLTRNLLIDHYRRTKLDRRTDSIETVNEEGESVPMPLPAPGRGAEHAVWGREVHEHVQRALLHLSPELREAVILRDLQDLDYKEIAAVLHLPEGTVKSRINRGRCELARLLRPSLRRGAAPGTGDDARGGRTELL
ncbi:MAG TPA: sigma-70 family RNA polymerase sigma factor [Terriglobales bacterium]|nr:sigma-70 family RNA polymerase sigma factor [Terriglobales bacterium]